MRGFDSDRLLGRRYRTYKFIYRFCRQERMDPERFWALPYERLRFTVGESFRNLKVPFAATPVLVQSVNAALDELLVLARMRFARMIETEEYDRMILTDAYGTAELPPVGYDLPEEDAPSLADRIVAGSVGIDAFLDAGLLRGWLREEAHGGILLGQLTKLFRKAFLEERSLVRTEPTTYLTQLAVLTLVVPAWHAQLARTTSAAFAERIETAVAVALHAVFDELVHAAFENPVLVDSTLIDVKVEYLLKTATSPLTFVRDPASIVGSEANPYGFGPDVHAAAIRHWEGFDPMRDELDALVDLATAEIARDPVPLAAAVESAWVAELRRHVVQVLAACPDASGATAESLARLAQHPGELRTLAFSRGARARMVETLQAPSALGPGAGPESAERCEALAGQLAAGEALRRDPARAFGRAVVPESLLRESVRAVGVWLLDARTCSTVEGVSGILQNKRLDEKTVIVAAEYEAGRLYRLAADEHPILRRETAREEAHLFVDLKDFTKKTYALKEVNMADFLRGEFYGPMLDLARQILGSRAGEFTLNNLLGDAISFSGDVMLLLEFAERTQELLGSYRDKLRARVPESVVRGELERLEKRYGVEKGRIAEKRARLEGVLRDLSAHFRETASPERTGTFSVGSGLLGEINRATNALYKLEEREAELEREMATKEEFLTGADIVAGVFISWGSPAVTVRMADPVFGDVKVAIAEKINEAARGTARNPEVKRRLDQRVEDELAARRAADPQKTEAARLEYPFRVHIDKFWSLAVPLQAGEEFRRVMEMRDVKAAETLFRVVGEQAYADFARAVEERRPHTARWVAAVHDIYNAGIAVSEETLGALQRVAKEKYRFFAKSFDVSELDESFRHRFVFDSPRIRAVFVVPHGADRPKHVFRYAGSMVFRGFEQRHASGIYELLNPRDPFSRMLVERVFPSWYKAFRERRGGPDGLEPFSLQEDAADAADHEDGS